MADPCVDSNEYIGLDTTGSPAVLEATWLNPETVFNGTQGDDTTHNVTDHNTQHTLTQTWPLTNSGSAPATGIVVVAINPIWVTATSGDITVVPFSRLTIDGVIKDERDIPAVGLDIPMGTTQLVSLGSLVGDYVCAAGDSIDIDWLLEIENIGASQTWGFRMGGSRMEAVVGY